MPFDESWSKFDSLMGLPPKLPEQEIDPHPDPWGRFDEIMATPAPEPIEPAGPIGAYQSFMAAGADVAKRVPAKFMEGVRELPEQFHEMGRSELTAPGGRAGMAARLQTPLTEAEAETREKRIGTGVEAFSTITGPGSVAVGEAALEADLPPAAALALELVASLPEGAGFMKLFGKAAKATKGLKVFKRGEKAAEVIAKKAVKPPVKEEAVSQSFKQLQVAAEETAEAVSKKPPGVEALPPVEKGKTRLYRWEGEEARKAGAAGGVKGGAWWETGPGTYYQKGAKGRYLDIPESRFKQLQDKPTSTEIELVGKDIGAAQRVSKEIPIEEKVFKQVSRRESIEGGGLPMPKTLPERVGPGKGLKLSRFQDEPQFEEMIRRNMTATANIHRAELQHWRRGGKVPDVVTRDLATEMGKSPDELRKIINKNVGDAYSDRELLVLGSALKEVNKEADRLGAAIAKAGASATRGMEAEWKAATIRAVAIQAKLGGAATEGARALRILGEVGKGNYVDTDQLNAILRGGTKAENAFQSMLNRIKSGENVRTVIGQSIKKPGFWDKMFEWRIAQMLTNPKTIAIINPGSSVVFKGMRVQERSVAGVIQAAMDATGAQKLAGKLGFEKRTPLTEATGEIYGMLRALPYAFHLAKDFKSLPGKALDVGKMGKSILWNEKSVYSAFVRKHAGREVAQKYEADFVRAIGGKKGKVVRAGLNSLVLGDDFSKAYSHITRAHGLAFRKAAGEARMGTKKFRELVDKYLYDPDIFDAAVKEAEEITYVDENAFTQFVATIRGAKIPLGEGYQPVRWIIPFGRVPANLTHKAAERMPFLGYAFQIYKVAKKQRSIAEGMAIPLAPTLVTLAGLGALFESGRITGTKPLPGSQLFASKQIPRAAGWAPDSVLWGDRYVSYRRLEPLGNVVSTVVDSYIALREYQEGFGTEEAFNTIAKSVAKNVSRQSFLGEIGEFVDSWVTGKTGEGVGETSATFAGQFAGSILPASGAMGEVARYKDPLARETKGFKGALYRQIPGARETLKPRKDYFEREMPSKEKWGFATKVPSQSELKGLMKAEKIGNLKRRFNKVFPEKEESEATPQQQEQMLSRMRKALQSFPDTTRRIRLATKSIKEGGPSGEVTRQIIGRQGAWEILLKQEYREAKRSGNRGTMNAIKREARRVGLRISWDLVEE